MRILLINPAQSVSLYTFSEISDITGVPAFMPNLAIPTLAALTPSGIEVHCVDDTCDPVDYETPWDLVGITGYITQKRRMFEIADEFRRRGRLVGRRDRPTIEPPCRAGKAADGGGASRTGARA